MKPRLDGTHRLDVLVWMADVSPPKCCFTCEEYKPGNGYCMEYDSRPPEDFRETGCDKWILQIPF